MEQPEGKRATTTCQHVPKHTHLTLYATLVHVSKRITFVYMLVPAVHETILLTFTKSTPNNSIGWHGRRARPMINGVFHPHSLTQT